MKVVEFIVWGEPCGKGRPRFTKDGRAYTPAKTRTYEAEVVSSFRRDCPRFEPWEKGVPLILKIRAYFGIAESKSASVKARMRKGEIEPTKRPDLDNCVKCVTDGISGIAFWDDAQIVKIEASKHYSDIPRVEVQIREAAWANSPK